jgi:hypothetical protein
MKARTKLLLAGLVIATILGAIFRTSFFPSKSAVSLPRDSWKDAGLATPEATVQTAAWSAREGNMKRGLDVFEPDVRKQMEILIQNDPAAGGNTAASWAHVRMLRIIETRHLSPDEAEVITQIDALPVTKQKFKRFGQDWKIAGEPQEIETK